jgi:rod shape-determining protein MreC
MIAIPSRHKSLTLLAGVIVAQLLLLAVQIKRQGQVRLIRVWTVELMSPVQRASSWVFYNLGHGWGNYVSLRHTREDDQALRAELDRLKVRNAELEGRALEADRLAGLLKFRDAHADVPMAAARVIGGSPDSGSQIVYIDRGSRDGLKRDMGVITPDGVVGKLFAVYPDTSQVLLMGDKDSGVGAMLAGTRTQGVVKGTSKPELLMDYVSNDTKVELGEEIYSSGQDRIFPKDLPIGTVAEITTDRRSPFMQIMVKPSAHLDRLEEVLILLTRQDLEMKKESEASPAVEQPFPVPVKAAESAH